MSVGLYKYEGDIFDDAKEVLSENIASQAIYDKYLKPAIKQLNIHYFKDGAEIKKQDLDSVVLELDSIIQWTIDNVEGNDKEYLLLRLQNIKKIMPKALTDSNEILYIF